MMEISHTYTLTADWQKQFTQQLVEEMGAELIEEKLLLMPKSIADGGFYFTGVIPGLSVVIWDLTFKKPIKINSLKSDDDLYIIHYNLSDGINLINIQGANDKIGYKSNLGLGVFDNVVDKVFHPIIGERIFAMRLLVAKDLLNFPVINGTKNEHDKRKAKKSKSSVFFYDHIDSESMLIIHDIKSKSFQDPAFDIYLKGVVFRLLGTFIDRYSKQAPILHYMPEKEIEFLNITKEYLLDNLFANFPGIKFLANMANMSVSKYTSSFKKMFVNSPNHFFIRERMILANKLLKSGSFDSLMEVSKELNFCTLSYFSLKYYKQFGRRPSDDFVKNTL
ncbi:AraC family transcriptional regulator [Flavobacterium sp. LS1R47]|uniref:AraC family transcriptional regulator n=1 Tax=Flavobacterium frigoritolerans TaxID=2987686 RepID=A0A9X3HMS7_9FLAO|nr:AraC family transcriptional regulator [Flavobacterium frigoritolerans]MCV9934326.1 AraC family transcriptional regulator [Flavobacterium frigoritolerans]